MVTKHIDYELNGTKLKGFAAYDDTIKGPRKLVVVFHDWDGVNEHEENVCKKLAQKGYVAFAADVFGTEAKVSTISERQATTKALYEHPDWLLKLAQKGISVGETLPGVRSGETVAIGYCFGGAPALATARHGAHLRGVVTFHGTLATSSPMPEDAFKGKVLILTGGADPVVPESQVEALKSEMKTAGVPVRVVTYPGVGHAFTVPGPSYVESADKASWKEFMDFLNDTLKLP